MLSTLGYGLIEMTRYSSYVTQEFPRVHPVIHPDHDCYDDT